MKVTLITVSRNVAPVIVESLDSVLAASSSASKDLEAYLIYQGNPAVAVRERTIA